MLKHAVGHTQFVLLSSSMDIARLLTQVLSSMDIAWLLTQVMRDAADGQVISWMRTLEEESGIVPLWEVIFQLMCHPVPQVSCLLIEP